jgi:threonine synthase
VQQGLSEAEIANASEDLLSEGLAVETGAALPIAGLRRLAERDLLPKAAAIVCVLTASGLRWPVAPPPGAPQPIEVPDGRSVIDLLM